MQFDCTICSKQGGFWRDLGIVCVTKCGHIFHLNCLMTQMSSQSKAMIKCPVSVCNKKVKQASLIQIDLTVVENGKDYQINQPVACSLCADPLTDPENLSVTICGHIYHFVCLVALAKQKPSTCLVSSCKIKLTKSSIIQIHFLLPASDVIQSNEVPTLDEQQDLLEDKNNTSLNNKESKNTPLQSSLMKDTPKEIHPVLVGNYLKCHIKQEASPSTDELPPLLSDKKVIYGQKNEQINQQIKNNLEHECSMNLLVGNREKSIEVTQNQEIAKLKQQYKAMEEQMEALKKERIDAKKEATIWEKCFKCLQENFEGTQLMIPDTKTLEFMKENEQLKIYTGELKRERNDAKKETAVWEICFKYLQDQFKGTDMMIPNEKTLELLKENEKQKTCIQDLQRELISTKNGVKSGVSLRADFENHVEEKLILKSENETMKSDIKTVKEEMNKLYSMIIQLVSRQSLENDTLKELNASLVKENTRLASLNETIQKKHSFLKDGYQGTSKRSNFDLYNTDTEIRDVNDLVSEVVVKEEFKNERVINEQVDNQRVANEQVENEGVLNEEVGNEVLVKEEVEIEEMKIEEMENYEPENKRVKLELNTDR